MCPLKRRGFVGLVQFRETILIGSGLRSSRSTITQQPAYFHEVVLSQSFGLPVSFQHLLSAYIGPSSVSHGLYAVNGQSIIELLRLPGDPPRRTLPGQGVQLGLTVPGGRLE